MYHETHISQRFLVSMISMQLLQRFTLQWRHNGRNGISNHQPHDCLLNRLFGHRSKKTSKLRVTSLCEGNSPVTGEFPAQRASYAENVSIWWRHHDMIDLFIATQTLGTPIDYKSTSMLRNQKLLVPRWHCWFISIIDFSRKPLFLYFVSNWYSCINSILLELGFQFFQ